MLCVLKTTVSMIRFFWAPKTRVYTDEDNRNFTLKLLNLTNFRALGSEMACLCSTIQVQCNSIVWTLNAGLLSSAEFSAEITVF